VGVVQLKAEVRPAVGLVDRLIGSDIQAAGHLEVDDQRGAVQAGQDVFAAPPQVVNGLAGDPGDKILRGRGDQAVGPVEPGADDDAPDEGRAQPAHHGLNFG